jgi:hypothetical protein
MKKRTRFIRVMAFATIAAAGAGIAIMASNEEGREKLAATGRRVSQSASIAGEYLSNGWQFASQWVESFRNQDEATFLPYTQQPYQQNGNAQHHQELSHSH